MRAVVAAAVLAMSARGQCSVGWAEGFAQPSLDSAGSLLGVYDDGTGSSLFVGASVGGVAASGLVRWNGVEWSGMPPTGPGGITARSCAVWDDGSGPALFAAGRVNYTSYGIVAKRVSTGWQIIGSAPPGYYGDPVMALRVWDDGSGPALYAAGGFSSIEGVATNCVAKWNGAAWSAISTLGFGRFEALAVYDDGTGPALYALGQIDLGGVAAGIVRFSGGAWVPVGGDVDQGGGALQVFDDGSGPALFVGGSFGRAGPRSASKIAKWGPLRPRVVLAQPGGPGTGITVRNTWLERSHEYLDIFSTTPCGGLPGGGPYLGLCAPNPSILIQQVAMPIGTPPFHFSPPFDQTTFGPYPGLAAGLTLDAVCFEWMGGALGCRSTVSRMTVQ